MVRAALFKYLMLEQPVIHSPTGAQVNSAERKLQKAKSKRLGRFGIKVQVNRVSFTGRLKGYGALTQSSKATHS